MPHDTGYGMHYSGMHGSVGTEINHNYFGGLGSYQNASYPHNA